MDIFLDLDQWAMKRKQLDAPGISLGFVPTMGNLHQGHAALYKQSLAENDYTIASLFINPTQFNHPDDFTHYPRTQEDDLALLESLGVDYCLLPDAKAIYSDGYQFQVQENQYSRLLEGEHRPGHFNGVLTVVMKLLNLTRPHRAYFGEKDYQQWLLIRDMVEAFFMGIDIIACPTVREPSGLAYSSRNNRLNPEQRQKAELFARIFHQKKSCQQIKKELLQAGIPFDYIEEQGQRYFAAVLIDGIRLIDNYALMPSDETA